MNSLMPFTLLSDVKPFKCGWKIHVKVSHKYMIFLRLNRDITNLHRFVYEHVTGMQDSCFVQEGVLGKQGKAFTSWSVENIQNFSLSRATGMPTEHSYKMAFVHNTTITRSNHVNEDMFLSLVDFQLVMSGSLQQCFLIDVLCQVVELEELETIQVSGKPRRKLEFHLRDINDSKIPCCLWGNYAEILYEGCTQNKDGMTEIQVCNAFEASEIVINPPIAEVGAFKELFKVHLMVKDDTGEERLMLLDMVARGLISESATELLNGSFDELEDPDDLPEAISQIVGKTFTFRIYVEKEHIFYGSKIYKSVLHLNDGEDNNEEMSTPTTKCKDDSVDARSIYSSTRNLRSKVIKVEKMLEL
ncbi:hypothetical protein Bca101_082714 [Brassica carinata]